MTGRRGRASGLPVAIELAQVVAGGDQFPFAGAGLDAAALEAADAAVLLDLAEDRFDHPATLFVEPRAALCRQLAPHPLAGRESVRDAPRALRLARGQQPDIGVGVVAGIPASTLAPDPAPPAIRVSTIGCSSCASRSRVSRCVRAATRRAGPARVRLLLGVRSSASASMRSTSASNCAAVRLRSRLALARNFDPSSATKPASAHSRSTSTNSPASAARFAGSNARPRSRHRAAAPTASPGRRPGAPSHRHGRRHETPTSPTAPPPPTRTRRSAPRAANRAG